MDVAVRFLSERTEKISEFGECVYIHCVAGAGKSTLIRELINLDERFVAYTYGVPDTRNLSGRYIKDARGVIEVKEGEILILDEYLARPEGARLGKLNFADPCQSCVNLRIERANFVAAKSYRFGKRTCALLRALKIECTSDREDKVEVANIFREDPRGVVLAHEKSVKDLLKAHQVDYKEPEEVRGSTFEIVTYVTEGLNKPGSLNHLEYMCLTRHTKEILILCADDTFTSLLTHAVSCAH